MHEDSKHFPFGKETYELIGCGMEVLRELRGGLFEKPYENAMIVEFRIRGIPFQQQPSYRVHYKGVDVGKYVPDLVAFGKVIVDLKVIERIGQNEIAQMLNYLRITQLPVGLILNFKHQDLEYKRVVL